MTRAPTRRTTVSQAFRECLKRQNLLQPCEHFAKFKVYETARVECQRGSFIDFTTALVDLWTEVPSKDF